MQAKKTHDRVVQNDAFFIAQFQRQQFSTRAKLKWLSFFPSQTHTHTHTFTPTENVAFQHEMYIIPCVYYGAYISNWTGFYECKNFLSSNLSKKSELLRFFFFLCCFFCRSFFPFSNEIVRSLMFIYGWRFRLWWFALGIYLPCVWITNARFYVFAELEMHQHALDNNAITQN